MITSALDASIFTFVLASIGLLGSPGPAIAALLAVGKVHGLGSGLWFNGGLQIGLAVAAAISAAGFVSILTIVPGLSLAMTIAATIYLIYLAWKIGTAPLSHDEPHGTLAPPQKGFVWAGFVVGITNPKAYVAFAALMTPVTLVVSNDVQDALLKWALVVAVMNAVDLLWLLAGVWLGRAILPRTAERLLNISLALMIILAAGLAVF